MAKVLPNRKGNGFLRVNGAEDTSSRGRLEQAFSQFKKDKGLKTSREKAMEDVRDTEWQYRGASGRFDRPILTGRKKKK